MKAIKTKSIKKLPNSSCDISKKQILPFLIQRIAKEVLLGYQEMIGLCASNAKDDSPGEDVVPESLFTFKISKYISDAENCFRIEKVVKLMNRLQKQIHLAQKSTNIVSIDEHLRLLAHLTPFLNQYFQVIKICYATSLGMHRTSCKLLSILLTVFHALATKGFCIPPDLQEEAEKSGSTKFEDIESGGLGDGEGSKDVSENIETEDQLEDTFKEGEEKEKKEDESDVKEEEKGIEMSEDFEGKTYDPEKGDKADESDEEDESENLDKKMGDVEGEDSEKLDEKVWGSDAEDDDNDQLEDEGDTGGEAQNKQSELVAKDGKQKENEYKNKDEQIPEEHPEDLQNEDEYQGETADPLIDAPKEKAPEIADIPDDIEITDNDDTKEDNASNDEAMEEENENNSNDDDSVKDMEASECENDEKDDIDDSKEDNKAETEDNVENADAAEPCEEENGDNAQERNEDSRLPTDTPTTENKAIPSADQSKKSNDPVETNEMDWESNSKQPDEQHKEGDAESKNASDQGAAHEGKKSSAFKQSGEDHHLKPKPTASNENRTIDKDATAENIKQRPVADKQSQQKSLGNEADEDEEADVYEHVSKEEDGVAQSVDLATQEQAKIKPVNFECENDADSDQEIIELSSSEEEEEESELRRERGEVFRRNEKQQKAGVPNDTCEEENMDITEGEVVQTHTVPRGLESNLYTQHELWLALSQTQLLKERSVLEKDLNSFDNRVSGENLNQASIAQWRKYEDLTFHFGQDLCEQLRLVLEPTKMTKLKGDYRTGKRLNMRKIIAYIASQFRKDKIWLRRTKPSKRQYQIMLAVDDSSSMADNHSKQLTFETLSVLGQALSLLEAGELGVASFGEKVELLLGFNEIFDTNAGAKMFQRFSFAQKKTDIAQLVNYVTDMMLQIRNSGAELVKETAQLLVILSDGRGIFSLGESEVRQAVRRARDNNVFMVFVIIDSPLNKDSILDIKSTEFGKDGVVFKPYIESFPFPFYIILREISALPVVLGEALRQWFELVTSVER